MANNFKCVDCGYRFQSEGYAETCPSCGSDNITPDKAGNHVLSVFLTVVLGLSLGAGGGYLVPKSSNHMISQPTSSVSGSKSKGGGGTSLPSSRPASGAVSSNSSSSSRVVLQEVGGSDADIILQEEPVALVSSTPSISSTSGPTLSSNGRFTFRVVAYVESEDRLDYELKDEDGLTIVSSTDGSFSNIQPSSNGTYHLVVTNNRTGESLEQPVSGFNRPVREPIQRITENELQNIFDSQRRPSNFNDKFTVNYVLTVNGLESDEPQPDRIDEIFNRLTSGAWSRVEVKSVMYDDMNKIRRLELDVIY